MDLALNNLQMLICHKTQTTKQPKLQRSEKTKPTKISGKLENYSRLNSLAEILSKEKNTRTVLLIRYSGSFLKWTRNELKQMDQRKRKLMTMHKALHPRLQYQKKKEEEDWPSSKTALTYRYKDSKTTQENIKEDS